jgi:DNA-binding transcriptional LysR family regulator
VIGSEACVELRTFRYFVAVADSGSVNAAAHALHLTQPSLARQLRRLERRLALPLLELRGGRTVLTVVGHQFLPYARELLATANATLAAANTLADGLAEDLLDDGLDDLKPEDETAA